MPGSFDQPSVQACIALGSNLGDRLSHIEAAFAALTVLPQTSLLRRSEVLETEPVGPAGQGRYLNAAAVLDTTLTARALLDALLEIERSRGRVRAEGSRWGARTLDLDLLLYGNHAIDQPGLIVPHPRMHLRAFVLEPLAQIAPDAPVPGLAPSVRELLRWLRSG